MSSVDIGQIGAWIGAFTIAPAAEAQPMTAVVVPTYMSRVMR